MIRHSVSRWLLLFVAFFLSLTVLAAAQVAPQEQKLIASQPVIAQDDAGALLARAQDLLRKGSFDQAIAGYNEVLKSDPQSGAAYAGIVRCYLKQDNVHNAAEWLAKGLQTNSEDPRLKEAQAELLFRQGRIAESEHIFVQLINSGKAPARAYLGLAKISSATALYAREHRLLLRAHELDSGDPDIQREWMRSLPRADRVKALESYLAETHGDDAETQRSIGKYLEMLKARQEASNATCRMVSDVSATETDLRPLLRDASHLRGFGLPVVVNGQKSTLLFDTGAGGIIIHSGLAERAGLKRLSDTHFGGIGDQGPAKGYTAYAESIRIGKLEFRNCVVGVVEKRSSAFGLTIIEDEEGLIGADVFERFLIEIDFPKRKLNLSPLPPRPGEPAAKPSLAIDEEKSSSESDSNPANSPASPPPAPRYFDRFIGPEMKTYTPVLRFGHMRSYPPRLTTFPVNCF